MTEIDEEAEAKHREQNRGIIDRVVANLEEDFHTFVAQTSDHSLNFPVSRSDSIYLWDAYGNSFLDFTSGIGVNNIGNRNFNVMNAIKEQLDHYVHTMVYGEHVQRNQVEYAKRISGLFPPRGDLPQQVFFVNSGNEAIDLALKIARKVSGRKPVLSMTRGFHGRGYGAMSVTWNENYKKGFFVDDSTRFITPGEPRTFPLSAYGAVILELVQGEAGCISLPGKWVQELIKEARNCGVPVIIDEVQTGYGRTGTFLAQEQYQVHADITCLGKAGGGGLPFGAVVASKEYFDKLQSPALSHLSTFGGNPVVMAAGIAVFDAIHEGLLENVKEVGSYLEKLIKELAVQFPGVIKGITGLGLMRGLVLNEEWGPELTERFYTECLKRGLLLHFKLNAGFVLRMSPPLIISDRAIGEAVNIMTEVCMELENK